MGKVKAAVSEVPSEQVDGNAEAVCAALSSSTMSSQLTALTPASSEKQSVNEGDVFQLLQNFLQFYTVDRVYVCSKPLKIKKDLSCWIISNQRGCKPSVCVCSVFLLSPPWRKKLDSSTLTWHTSGSWAAAFWNLHTSQQSVPAEDKYTHNVILSYSKESKSSKLVVPNPAGWVSWI